MNAFEKYLLAINRIEAINHVIECLRSGQGELAWDMLERINGNWLCSPANLPNLINETLNKIANGES